MKFIRLNYVQYAASALISLIAAVYILIKCKFILAPLVIALLVSSALSSLLAKVKKIVKSNILAVTLVNVIFFSLVFGVFYVIGYQLIDFCDTHPDIGNKMSVLLRQFENSLESALGIRNIDFVETTEENSEEIIKSGSSILLSFIGDLGVFITYVTLIPLYIFLIMLYKDKIKLFIKKILLPLQINPNPVFAKTSTLVEDYLKGMLIIFLLLGLANGIGLLIIDVPYAFALGFIASLLAIIPYIGVVIGSLMVLFVSFVTQQSISQLISISILFGVIQFIEGNFLTPKIIGDKINLNPLFALIMLIVGEQLWGVIGMIVVLPITAIAMIMVHNLKDKLFLENKI
ncbi:AI-2E family transporter [Wenyingzhuangia sp. IMCC45533]